MKQMKNQTMTAMDEQQIFQLEGEIQQKAGLDPDLAKQWDELERMRITPDTEIPPMEFLFEIDGKPCFPLGELSALSGRAKSGKTYFASLLMAACFRPEVMGIRRISDQPLHVLWYDTEQGLASTQLILKSRILPLIHPPRPLPDTDGETVFPAAHFEIFNARCKLWNERQGLLEAAIDKFKPQLVILDGIRDLTDDINSNTRSQNVMERLMKSAQENRCCILCLIHQNKSLEDRSMRGSLGGELLNKAFEVYEIVNQDEVFSVEQRISRNGRIRQKYHFRLDKNGMPVYVGFQEAGAKAQGSGSKLQASDGRSTGMPRPKFNEDYVKEVKENGFVEFNDVKLFADALKDGQRLNDNQLRQRVKELSGITTPPLYYAVFYKARDRGIITGVLENDGIMRYSYTPSQAELAF